MAQLGNLQLSGLQPAVSVWRALRLGFAQKASSASMGRLISHQAVSDPAARPAGAVPHCRQPLLPAARTVFAGASSNNPLLAAAAALVPLPPTRQRPACCTLLLDSPVAGC